MSIDRKKFSLPVLIKLTINWSNKIQSMKVFVCGPPRVSWDWEENFSKVKKLNISVFSSDGGLYWIEGQKGSEHQLVGADCWTEFYNFDINIHKYSQYLDKVCTMNSLYLKLECLYTLTGGLMGPCKSYTTQVLGISAPILGGENMSKCSS